MCKTCSEQYPNNSVYDNWMLHHRPFQTLYADEECVLNVSLTAILTYRLTPFTIEEIMYEFNIPKEKATTVATLANRITMDIQEMLLGSMEYK